MSCEDHALLAVYGTLRKGFKAHRIIGSEPVWSGFISIPYKLVVKDCTPYLVADESLHRVFVEVYKVSCDVLRRVDEFEDVPREYIRVEIYIHPHGFAYMYISPKSIVREYFSSGDFAEYACRRCKELLEDYNLCKT